MLAGHRGDVGAATEALGDDDAGVRAAALGALARSRRLDDDVLRAALSDRASVVRRRACELAAGPRGPGASLGPDLRRVLGDDDALVVESACWALGEHRDPSAVPGLAAVASAHPDTRCREAAVAALGAVGHPSGLPAVLAALGDRPTVRRRATVALAAFDGPEVDDALRRSAADRDWQVREVAEILIDADAGGDVPPGHLAGGG